MKEQELCKKRLLDLSRQAERKGIVLFSDFLNLNELTIYRQCQGLFESRSQCFGGIPHAERQMIAFFPEALSLREGAEKIDRCDYPIAALQAAPAHPKFAEKLSHRDYLGAITSLGVDRGKIGDILVHEGGAFILCEEGMASYFMENLQKIRHTQVTLRAVPCEEVTMQQNFLEQVGIITSNRLDAVLACVCHLSRKQALNLLRQEKVFVNGKSTDNPGYSCRAEDIVSVRGFGRFIYQEECGATHKGRLKIRYQLYQN